MYCLYPLCGRMSGGGGSCDNRSLILVIILTIIISFFVIISSALMPSLAVVESDYRASSTHSVKMTINFKEISFEHYVQVSQTLGSTGAQKFVNVQPMVGDEQFLKNGRLFPSPEFTTTVTAANNNNNNNWNQIFNYSNQNQTLLFPDASSTQMMMERNSMKNFCSSSSSSMWVSSINSQNKAPREFFAQDFPPSGDKTLSASPLCRFQFTDLAMKFTNQLLARQATSSSSEVLNNWREVYYLMLRPVLCPARLAAIGENLAIVQRVQTGRLVVSIFFLLFAFYLTYMLVGSFSSLHSSSRGEPLSKGTLLIFTGVCFVFCIIFIGFLGSDIMTVTTLRRAATEKSFDDGSCRFLEDEAATTNIMFPINEYTFASPTATSSSSSSSTSAAPLLSLNFQGFWASDPPISTLPVINGILMWLVSICWLIVLVLKLRTYYPGSSSSSSPSSTIDYAAAARDLPHDYFDPAEIDKRARERDEKIRAEKVKKELEEIKKKIYGTKFGKKKPSSSGDELLTDLLSSGGGGAGDRTKIVSPKFEAHSRVSAFHMSNYYDADGKLKKNNNNKNMTKDEIELERLKAMRDDEELILSALRRKRTEEGGGDLLFGGKGEEDSIVIVPGQRAFGGVAIAPAADDRDRRKGNKKKTGEEEKREGKVDSDLLVLDPTL